MDIRDGASFVIGGLGSAVLSFLLLKTGFRDKDGPIVGSFDPVFEGPAGDGRSFLDGVAKAKISSSSPEMLGCLRFDDDDPFSTTFSLSTVERLSFSCSIAITSCRRS